MIRLIIYVSLLAAVIYAGSTVKLGKRTFFEHARAIWHTEQVQDLKTGVAEKAQPAVDKLKRGGEAAYKAMKPTGHADNTDAGAGDQGADAGAKGGDAGAPAGSGAKARDRTQPRR